MKIVVTGGRGFIGTQLCNKLRQLRHEVVVIDSRGSTSKGETNLFKADISNPKHNNETIEAIKGAECIFHLAAQTSVPESIEKPLHYDRVNTYGTLNVLELCRRTGIRKIIFSSSSAVYGDSDLFPTKECSLKNPLSPYGLQKLIGEEYLKLYSSIYGIKGISLRYFNDFGQGMPTKGSYCGVVGAFLGQRKEGKNLTIFGNGENSRDFVHVEDVVESNIKAWLNIEEFDGEAFNVGSGQACSVNKIAEAFGGSCEYLSPRIEPLRSLADIDKIKKSFKWEPTENVLGWINNYLK